MESVRHYYRLHKDPGSAFIVQVAICDENITKKIHYQGTYECLECIRITNEEKLLRLITKES